MAENNTQRNGINGAPEAHTAPAGSVDASHDLGINFSADLREVIGTLPPENKGNGTSQKQQRVAAKTPQERKAELLARLPKEQQKAERFMRRQIESSLEKQLHELEDRLHKTSNYYAMNTIMAKIREFRDVLDQLISVAFEQMKALWLRFVHNLSL